MRKNIENALNNFIEAYCAEQGLANIWQTPIIRYASVDSPVIRQLKMLVIPEHRMPEDFLADAKSILSYYMPFKEDIGKSNIGGDLSSPEWANAYIVTNVMAVQLNLSLVEHIKGLGYDAVSPGNPGRVNDKVFLSNWSQRHIAYAAGHGSFGLNNMLITEKGCCGRYFSVVSSLAFADEECKEERCLYKRQGTCKLCVSKCLNGALTTEGFDRQRCSLMGDKNAKVYGSTICGKCVAGMPCAYRAP